MSDLEEVYSEKQARREQRPQRKIAICGTAPSSLGFAPWQDESWEIWGTSNSWHQLPRWDVWFEVHSLEYLANHGERDKHIEWLFEDHGPDKVIYAQEEMAHRMPNGVPYPKEIITDQFPSRYFTNSVSWMIAYAIYMQADQVGIYGVDMALSSEYGDQRPSCEYFIGMARGSGIPVHIPDQADLLKTRRMYGFGEKDAFERNLDAREEELRRNKQQLEQQLDQMRHKLAQYSGALDQAKWDKQNHMHK